MTRTPDDPTGQVPPHGASSSPTRGERALVLGGFAAATLATAWSAFTAGGIDVAAAAWLAAGAWAAASSLALALRRGLHRRDWSAFRRHGMPFDTDLVDWSTNSGSWLNLADTQENERLMRGD